MVNPLHNNIFFDDYHRYVLQDANLVVPPSSPIDPPKKPFRIEAVSKSEKGIAKNKKSKKNTKEEDSPETS